MSKVEETVSKPVVDDVTLRGWIQRDIESAISVLNMIRNDPEMLKAIQDIVVTRVRIEEERKANGTDLFGKEAE